MKARYARCRSCGILFLQDKDASAGERVVCPGCRALERITGPHQGRVKWYDARKRYGFIEANDGAAIFLHASVLPPSRRRLRPGARVRFLIEQTERGPQAGQVTLLPD